VTHLGHNISSVRYLCIDLGQRYTGLATGDDETGIALPLDVINTRDNDTRMAALTRTIQDQEVDALVLGLPLNMDGSAGPAAAAMRAYAEKLQATFGLAVHLVDERLSSHAAEGTLRDVAMTRSKRKKAGHAMAAVVILQDFLAGRQRAPRTDSGLDGMV